MTHAKLAPSGAHRWIKCPGSVALCATMPEVESVYAREGSFAHEIAAAVLSSDHNHVASMLGTTDGEFTCTPTMAAHLQAYVDVVRARQICYDGELQVEQQVALTKDIWGTADALVWQPGRLDVFDLKYGAGKPVTARENPQLMTYAMAALTTFTDLAAEYRVGHVGVHIVQPRRPMASDDDSPHTSWDISVLDLQTWAHETLLAAAKATGKKDAAFASGDHCGFCLARGICPRLRQDATELAVDLFVDQDETLPAPGSLPPETIADALRRAAIIETWIAAVRDYALAAASRGDTIPGYKVVEKIGNRKWTDEAAALAMLTGAGVADPYQKKLFSPAQAEKALGKGAKSLVVGLCERPVTGVVLVPETDKRPAITVDPSRMFTALDD
jgi:hypothetical protein